MSILKKTKKRRKFHVDFVFLMLYIVFGGMILWQLLKNPVNTT